MTFKLNRKTFAAAGVSVLLAASMSPVQAFATPSSADLKAEAASVAAELTAMSDDVESAAENYNVAQRDYQQATAKVEEAQTKIDEAQGKISNLQTQLETRASAMYRQGATSYLSVLMGSSTFDDFATVWDTLNTLNTDDANLVAETKTAKQELESAKAELDDQQSKAQSALNEASQLKQTVEQKQAALQARKDSLSSEIADAVAKEQQEALAAQAAAAQAYTPAASSSNSSSSSSSSSKSSSSSSSKSSSSSSGRTYGGGSSAVSRAQNCLGAPYVYGAAGPSSFDCSGLVSYALTGSYGHAYVAEDFWAMPAVSNPQPGDVVACSNHHCGLYIGNGQMIEAPHTGAVVTVSAVRGKIVRP